MINYPFTRTVVPNPGPLLIFRLPNKACLIKQFSSLVGDGGRDIKHVYFLGYEVWEALY